MVKFNIIGLKEIARNSNLKNYSGKNKKNLLDYLILNKANFAKKNQSLAESFTFKELIYIAKMNKIKKYSNKCKTDLIKFLKINEVKFCNELYNTTKYIEVQFTIKELIKIAKDNNITLYSNKNKIKLVQYLMTKGINFTNEKNIKYGFAMKLE